MPDTNALPETAADEENIRLLWTVSSDRSVVVRSNEVRDALLATLNHSHSNPKIMQALRDRITEADVDELAQLAFEVQSLSPAVDHRVFTTWLDTLTQCGRASSDSDGYEMAEAEVTDEPID